MHVIAAKAVAFGEALRPSFRTYAEKVVKNAKALAEELKSLGLRLVSGGTDTHLLLVDLSPLGITGRDAAKALEALPPLEGPRIAVLSSQAGPGLIAADKVEAEGLRLARFSASTQRRIEELLPPLAMRTNPVDMGPAWYNPRAILGILEAVLEDEATDGVLFLNMFASANLKLATEVRDYLRGKEALGKPVIGCFSAPPGLWKEVQEVDQRKGFVILPTPERAARAMGDLWRWHRVRRRWLKGG